MKFVKYKCKSCSNIFIADTTRHNINSCKYGKGLGDLEEHYARLCNVEFIEEFTPPWFDNEDDYHSALLGWLNNSDEEYSLYKKDNVLFVEKVKNESKN